MLWYGHGSSLFILVVLAAFLLRAFAARRNGGRRRGPNGGGPYGGGPGGPGGRYGRYGGPFGGSATGPGGTRPPATTQTGTDQMTANPTGTATAASADPGGHTGIPAGWMVDPSGKHQQRYWSGTVWTEHVADDGVPGLDPPPA